ncbi:MAG: MFS transporter [Ilumatobacteraceae bacterium]
MTRDRTPGWYPLLLATASVGIANSVVFTLLSDLQDKYGFSDFGLGLIAGSGFLVGLIGQILLAPFADRGHAKNLMLAGLGFAVIGSISFAASSTLVMLVISRMIVGLSNSLFLPASRAVVISISDTDVARRLGTISGVELAGFVTGPMIGGLLVGPFGVRVPFLVAGSFAAAGMVLLWRRDLPEPPLAAELRLGFDLLRLPRVRAGVLMSLALFLPVGIYDATLDRYLTDLGAGNVLISLGFLAYGIPFALLATTGGRLADRHGALRVSFIAAVLVAPLTALYGFLPSAMLIVVFSGVEGSIQALGVPASQAVVADGAPPGRAASAQGLAGAGNLLIGAVTAYLAGPMYSVLGPRWMFSIAGMGILAFAVLAVTQGRSTRAELSSAAR